MRNTVPQTPRNRFYAQHDHTNSIQESQKSVKRKTRKRRMISCPSWREDPRHLRDWRKKVDSLQEVVKTLKENNYLTEQELEKLGKDMWYVSINNEEMCQVKEQRCNFQGKIFPAFTASFCPDLNWTSTLQRHYRLIFNYPTDLSSGYGKAPSIGKIQRKID